MASRLPVIVAIPNYNMGQELKQLLPLLIDQGYEAIVVLDDASTDDSRSIVKAFGHGVAFVEGRENQGAGANRNRIFEVVDHEALIHFIDADTRPDSKNMATLIQESIPNEDFAFLGGLAKTPDGLQNVWNYGPRPSLYNEIGAYRQHQFGRRLGLDRAQAKTFREKHEALLSAWPNPLAKPEARPVFWCIEQNVVFRSDVFKHYGGFDPSVRETEIIELALRMRRDNLHAFFDPRFVITHTEAQVRQYNRGLRKREETIRLAFRYGIRHWLFSR